VSPPRDAEYARLRRGFAIGVVASLVVMVLLGVAIHFANAGHHRPEGAAERWLTAIGDTTRKGVRADALKRVAEVGPFELGRPLLPAASTGGKDAFPDLEVGKATVAGNEARVPYQLHQRVASGTGPMKVGVVLLQRQADDRWHVTGLGDRRPGELVPSEGGSPPSSAPLGVWIGGALFGLLLTALVTVLVNWASPARQVSAAGA
jgi:hypothetical protein